MSAPPPTPKLPLSNGLGGREGGPGVERTAVVRPRAGAGGAVRFHAPSPGRGPAARRADPATHAVPRGPPPPLPSPVKWPPLGLPVRAVCDADVVRGATQGRRMRRCVGDGSGRVRGGAAPTDEPRDQTNGRGPRIRKLDVTWATSGWCRAATVLLPDPPPPPRPQKSHGKPRLALFGQKGALRRHRQ